MSFLILNFEPTSGVEMPQSGLNVVNDDESLAKNPSERMGHVCVTVANRYLVMWGGHRVRTLTNWDYLNLIERINVIWFHSMMTQGTKKCLIPDVSGYSIVKPSLGVALDAKTSRMTIMCHRCYRVLVV